ncbi:MAG TPA: 4Fe-4S ferredoxin [Acetobacteraceae bacterium]|nr:4Fe-4S ferredoxin [Acetobacteraceae bacterium]
MSMEDPSRRDALRVMGASLALAAAAGCDRPDEFGHPLHAPARGTPGRDARYATVLDLDGLGRGVLVGTRDGHAIKVEGNPRHPASLGATDIFCEAAVLSLHDPARSRRVLERGRAIRPATLLAAGARLRDALEARGGEGFVLLTGPVSSPTLIRLIAAVGARFPAAAWHVHDPMSDPAARAGAEAAFGEAITALPDLTRARALLCLGGGPLDHGPAQLRWARDWITGRAAARARGTLPRMIVAEATPSLSGERATRRIALHPSESEPFLRAVAAALGVPGLAAPAAHAAAPAVAEMLRTAGREALVFVARAQPPAVHALAHAINRHLGTEAQRLIAPPLAEARPMPPLLEAMQRGEVAQLLILDANPAHDLPGFAEALARVPASLHLGLRADETARLCGWHLPMRHPLESWGDSRAFDGTPAIRQPATRPLVEAAREASEVLTALLGTPASPREAVRDTWRADWGEESFEDRWAAALEEGVAGNASPSIPVALRAGWDRPGPAFPAGLAAVFAPDPHLRAGEGAHDAWLQELPRPITRLAWGQAALLAPATAAALGLAHGDEVELTLDGHSLRAPVWTVEGHAPDCVTLPLGGGHRAGGPVGEGRGFNAALLRPADGGWAAPGLVLRPTGRRVPLVTTEMHHRIAATTAAERIAPGEALPPAPPRPSLHPPWPYPTHAWGMAVDLDACIGCNACAIACQAENNVPVVGAWAMGNGRGLHWLRVDRHAQADGTAFQPVPCMQCEQAPSEPVCPVNATVHDHEGLNAMVYPRCVGTRTCSNNCPYKVRRFNFEDHRRATAAGPRNPEVLLRPRGVMEKCTYCSHRITEARTAASIEGRTLRDGDVETACARACPTQAIVFGDLNDPESRVARLRRDGRAYDLLGHLGTRPRTFYLARVVPGA